MSYTDIYGSNTNGLNMGTPTVNVDAAIASVGTNPMSSGIASPATAGVAGIQMPTPAGQISGGTPGPKGPGFFSEFGPAQFGLGAIQTLGSLWNSFQQNKLAKESFKFQKEAYYTNLENQEQSYNTALTDRINARYEGMSGDPESNKAAAKTYIEENRL